MPRRKSRDSSSHDAVPLGASRRFARTLSKHEDAVHIGGGLQSGGGPEVLEDSQSKARRTSAAVDSDRANKENMNGMLLNGMKSAAPHVWTMKKLDMNKTFKLKAVSEHAILTPESTFRQLKTVEDLPLADKAEAVKDSKRQVEKLPEAQNTAQSKEGEESSEKPGKSEDAESSMATHAKRGSVETSVSVSVICEAELEKVEEPVESPE